MSLHFNLTVAFTFEEKKCFAITMDDQIIFNRECVVAKIY